MTFSHSGDSELAQLMESTTTNTLIREIVSRGFQGFWWVRFLP